MIKYLALFIIILPQMIFSQEEVSMKDFQANIGNITIQPGIDVNVLKKELTKLGYVFTYREENSFLFWESSGIDLIWMSNSDNLLLTFKIRDPEFILPRDLSIGKTLEDINERFILNITATQYYYHYDKYYIFQRTFYVDEFIPEDLGDDFYDLDEKIYSLCFTVENNEIVEEMINYAYDY